MIRPHARTLICSAAALALAPASLGSVVFSTSNNNPNTTLVNATTATVVESGTTLTAVSSGGDLSITTTGDNLFGIPGNGAGTISAASEILSLSFDTDIFLDQIDLNQLGNGETATVSIPSLNLDFTVTDDGSAIVLANADGSTLPTGITGGPATGGSADTIDFAAGSFTLGAGATVNISVLDTFALPAGDSSVALQSVTVTAIPEPASLALIAMGGLTLLGRRSESR